VTAIAPARATRHDARVTAALLLVLACAQAAKADAPPHLRARVEIDVGGKPEWIAAGDVDGDGRADVLVALRSGELLVARSGALSAPERIAIGAYPLRPQFVRRATTSACP